MESPILDVLRAELQGLKKYADKAIAQLADEQLWIKLDPEANSVAILLRHMAGNMRSRWTEFLTTDGEKPDRNRDQEFEDPAHDRARLSAEWEDGWKRLFDALTPLSDADLQRTVYINDKPHTVLKAIVRQLAHYAGHTHQIVLLAKHLKGAEWTSLSIPRGQSAEFNQRLREQQKQP
jgi:hypothetical protein